MSEKNKSKAGLTAEVSELKKTLAALEKKAANRTLTIK
jgi:ribosomal protein L29